MRQYAKIEKKEGVSNETTVVFRDLQRNSRQRWSPKPYKGNTLEQLGRAGRNIRKGITFLITPYIGSEDEILRLRNRNRGLSRDAKYLDWRYTGQRSPHSPVIFWVIHGKAERIGMAGGVFRPYFVNNERKYFLVIGDISLNREYRGRGIGIELFRFISSYLDNLHDSSYLGGFVIPNRKAQSSFDLAGWVTKEKLVPFVLVLDPSEKLFELFNFKFASRLVGRAFRYLFWIAFKVRQTKGIQSQIIGKVDEDLELFWESIDKTHHVTRDRSGQHLEWRYFEQHFEKFSIQKIVLKNRPIGFVVYLIRNEACVIYDLMSLHDSLMKQTICSFVLNVIENKNIKKIVCKLNEKNKYIPKLKQMGFLERDSNSLIQVYLSEKSKKILDSYDWFITQGDKDS